MNEAIDEEEMAIREAYKKLCQKWPICLLPLSEKAFRAGWQMAREDTIKNAPRIRQLMDEIERLNGALEDEIYGGPT